MSEPRRKKLERDELARRLAEICMLEGVFTLRSGATSHTYFDKYQFEADPVLLASIARYLAPMVPDDTEVLAGLELGGVPIVTALSLATGLPAAFVRKQAKTYGTARLAEGHDIRGRHVLVVEDVVTTGGQVIHSTNDLREWGAIVEHALCVVDRGGSATLMGEGIKLHSLFTLAELEGSMAEPEADVMSPSVRHEPPPTIPPDATTKIAPPSGAPPLLPKREARSRPDRKVAPKLVPRRSDDPGGSTA